MEMSDYDRQSIPAIIAGHGDWYGAYLIRLIAKADRNNLRLLARVYPEEVRAVLEFMGYRQGEVFESLTSDCICGANTEDAKHPHPCHAHYIPEVFESLTRPLGPDKELPKTKDLTGIDPDFTGNLTTEEYIRSIRGGRAEECWPVCLSCGGHLHKDRVNYNDPSSP